MFLSQSLNRIRRLKELELQGQKRVWVGGWGSTWMMALLLVIKDWYPLEFPGPCVQELKTNKQTKMDRYVVLVSRN